MLGQKRINKTYPMDDAYFDDCPICQAQKRADSEERELKIEEYSQAAEEAEKLGGKTGMLY